MYVYRAIDHIRIVPPDGIEQILPAKHLAGI